MFDIAVQFNKIKGISHNAYAYLYYDFEMLMVQLLIENKVNFSVEHGAMMLSAEAFTISSSDMRTVVYEIDAKFLENNEISLRIGSGRRGDIPSALQKMLTDYGEIDVKKFIGFYRNCPDMIPAQPILGFAEKDTGLSVEMYVEGTILKICTRYEAEAEKQKADLEAVEEEKDSRLKSVIINDAFCLDMRKKELLHTINELEMRNIPFSVHTKTHHMMGHCIEIGCLYITAKDFQIVFECERVLEVHFGRDIVYNSYLITTGGDKYNVGLIVEDNARGNDEVEVQGYGADDAWHRVRSVDYRYVYSVGYYV